MMSFERPVGSGPGKAFQTATLVQANSSRSEMVSSDSLCASFGMSSFRTPEQFLGARWEPLRMSSAALTYQRELLI